MSARVLLTFAVLLAGCTKASDDTLRLYVFDCGRLQFDSVEALGVSDDETDVRELLVSCYVIDHPDGRMLFDGGLPASMLEPDGWTEMDGGWRMRQVSSLADHLAILGLGLQDIDLAAFSHFHFDHIGVANDLPETHLLVQQIQLEEAFGDSVQSSFDPTLYDRFPREHLQIIDGDHDVFGDGRVRILATPGHTAGHQSLYVRLKNTGPVLLSGDLFIMKAGRSSKRVPGFNRDSTLTVESMNRVESLLEQEGGVLWIGHDLENYERLKHPPLFMD